MQAIQQRQPVSFNVYLKEARARKKYLAGQMLRLILVRIIKWLIDFENRMMEGTVTKLEICTIIGAGALLCGRHRPGHDGAAWGGAQIRPEGHGGVHSLV